MKNKKIILLCFLLISVITSCKKDADPKKENKKTGFENEIYEVSVGNEYRCSYNLNGEYEFYSSNEKIFSIIEKGDGYITVKGNKKGAAILTAQKDNEKYQCVINVTDSSRNAGNVNYMVTFNKKEGDYIKSTCFIKNEKPVLETDFLNDTILVIKDNGIYESSSLNDFISLEYDELDF